jgi:hypothetical protein
VLNEDLYDTMHRDQDIVEYLLDNPPQILPALELVEHPDQKLVETKRFGSDVVWPRTVFFHAFLGATHTDYRGRGLTKTIQALTGAQFARSRHYAYACVEPSTNPITEHIWTKLGATVEYAMLTKDFETSEGIDLSLGWSPALRGNRQLFYCQCRILRTSCRGGNTVCIIRISVFAINYSPRSVQGYRSDILML